MVQDPETNLFVSVVYVICTDKTKKILKRIHQVVATTSEEIDHETVGCDFEVGFQDTVQVHFPEADIMVCHFHFKLACRRNIKKYAIPNH